MFERPELALNELMSRVKPATGIFTRFVFVYMLVAHFFSASRVDGITRFQDSA
ncbi:hypothetical protein [Endozoicomonas sp. 8E]|uniref:hypothetical protein n=1 Tax=Endozoicomonas sp. 8E TaxID=3035692 RepID=UPI002938FD6F|nr:hypothetical protein [Endozoicomonas sp. 8E]WOG29488.1 hypothetical protein P6910_07515 [Endozoicomonas sp. 8E]